MLVSTGLVLLVDDKVSRGHRQHRQKTEEDVGDEEELCLLQEELLVELELVLLHGWQIVEVDHVLVQCQVNVVALVDQDNGDECDEIDRIDLLIAVLHEEGGDEEAERDQVHAPAEDVVEAPLLALTSGVVLLLRDHRVNHDAEGEEERVLREE